MTTKGIKQHQAGGSLSSGTSSGISSGSSYPSPAARNFLARQLSHRTGPTNMMMVHTIPITGAAVAVVPKYSVGIRFWIVGVPGIALMAKVKAPVIIVAGIRRRVMSASLNSPSTMGYMEKMMTKPEIPP